jgi:hypothetical protein
MLTADRTFGVVTKLDLMDKGTNAVDVWKISVVQLFCAEPQGQLVMSLQISSLHVILGSRREAVPLTAPLGGSCQPLTS